MSLSGEREKNLTVSGLAYYSLLSTCAFQRVGNPDIPHCLFFNMFYSSFCATAAVL